MNLQYPIGQFEWPKSITKADRENWIAEIAALPSNLRTALKGLTAEQLDTPYRQGGWSVRQVVHHIPDSHLNSYIRFKWALTEENPAIKAYEEQLWAELPDTWATPIETSLALLDSLHSRWVVLLKELTEEQRKRTFLHPDRGLVVLESYVGICAWHGKHHVAHITSLRERNNW